MELICLMRWLSEGRKSSVKSRMSATKRTPSRPAGKGQGPATLRPSRVGRAREERWTQIISRWIS